MRPLWKMVPRFLQRQGHLGHGCLSKGSEISVSEMPAPHVTARRGSGLGVCQRVRGQRRHSARPGLTLSREVCHSQHREPGGHCARDKSRVPFHVESFLKEELNSQNSCPGLGSGRGGEMPARGCWLQDKMCELGGLRDGTASVAGDAASYSRSHSEQVFGVLRAAAAETATGRRVRTHLSVVTHVHFRCTRSDWSVHSVKPA